MVQDGFVTEGASSTAFIVTEADEIITRPLSQTVLPGITRMTMMQIARNAGSRWLSAPSAWTNCWRPGRLSTHSASTVLMPVVNVDGQRVCGGQPGPVARALRERYIAAVLEQPPDIV